MDIEELHKIECHALPGSGACGKYVPVALPLRYSNRTVSNLDFTLGLVLGLVFWFGCFGFGFCKECFIYYNYEKYCITL